MTSDSRPDRLGELMVPMWDRMVESSRNVLRPHLANIVDQLDAARPANVTPGTDSDPAYERPKLSESRGLTAPTTPAERNARLLDEARDDLVDAHGAINHARDLLARLDAAAPVAGDRRLDDLYAQAQAWVNENAASRKTHPSSPTHSARRVAPEEAANTVLNVVEGRLTGLAEHYARQSAPVAGEDAASPDEDVADPCIDDAHGTCHAPGHSWHEGQRRRSSSPAVAPDTPGAAPTRSVYVRLRPDVEVARTEQVLDVVAIDWSATDGAGEAVVVGVEVLGVSGVEVDGKDVLRGGGADGGGEDEDVERRPVDEFSDPQLIPTMWYSPSRATLRGSRTDGLIVERGAGTGRLYGYSAAAPGWRPFSSRMLLPDDAILLVGHGDYVAVHDIRRLARAAGVSPDSEDVVGEIEAAIRAGRERQVVTSPLRPDVLGKDAKWHERTDHSGTAIAIWLSEDDGSVWVTEDGEIAALSRYSGRYVSEWHGEAITAAHRWREDEMPVARGEVVSGKRAENAPHGTTLVRVDENGRALTGSSVIETGGGFNGSPSGRYRVLDLPAVVRVGTGGGETGEQ